MVFHGGQHVNHLLVSCAQSLFALHAQLRTLRHHDLPTDALHTIFEATAVSAVSNLSFASLAWWGFVSAAYRDRLEAFLRRSTIWTFVRRLLQWERERERETALTGGTDSLCLAGAHCSCLSLHFYGNTLSLLELSICSTENTYFFKFFSFSLFQPNGEPCTSPLETRKVLPF